jgi:sugar phosphate isomerase/epimerase
VAMDQEGHAGVVKATVIIAADCNTTARRSVRMRQERFRLSAFGDEIASDLDGQLSTLRLHGIRFLEVRSTWGTNVIDLSDADLRRIRERSAAEGMGVSAVASPVGKVPIDAAFDVERARCRRGLEAARQLGTPLVRIFSFLIPDGRYRQHRDEVVRRLAAFTQDAARAHVTLVLENESYVYGDTPERCLDVLQAVGSPALRMAFDPANFVQVGVRPHAKAWPLLRPYVAHVHIKDAVAVDRTGFPPYPERVPVDRLMDSVRLPGAGEGELRPVLRDLAADGYAGFLTLEPHLQRRLPEQGGPERLGAAVAALRRLVSEIARDE